MRKLELVQPCDFVPAYGDATPDPLVSRCRACGHSVRNLSEMSEADALSFLERKRPGECVRFQFDAEDDRVIFSDGVGSLAWRLAKGARPMIAIASLLAGCEGSPKDAGEAGIATVMALSAKAAEPATKPNDASPSASVALEASSANASSANASASAAPSGSACVPPSGSAAPGSGAPGSGAAAGVPGKTTAAHGKGPKSLQEMGGY